MVHDENQEDLPVATLFSSRTEILFLPAWKRSDLILPKSGLRLLFHHHRYQYSSFIPIFTDGSKSDGHVGCGVVFPSDTLSYRLHNCCSVFTAELVAIFCALQEISPSSQRNFIIYTDSMSALETLSHYDTQMHPLGRYLTAEEILKLMNQADSDLSSLSDDDEDEDDDDISILDLISSSNPGEWGIHTDAFPAPTSNFCQKSGVNYSSSKPIEYFLEYLDDDFFREMANCTNIRSVIQTGKSANVSPEEIQIFLGCSLLLPCYGYPRLKMVWERFTRIPVIADNIARDRFFQIRSNLKVINDNDVSDDSKKSDKFWKVRPLLSKIRERCLQQDRTTENC
ncbi:hypothetical protein AVEN_167886-1 [Araneus ventricosus]|uniref:Uncharacterized protein n=1 Tax=Araneus ventricosus TaxID=182803 RepID=A0A4Y2SWR1_ARAVE|nr:hypothetical protein AVEN_167886-1 [Araneus ventricosus]